MSAQADPKHVTPLPKPRAQTRTPDVFDAIGLDRRNRLAAAILMIGVDLPQPAGAWAQAGMAAARLCPGVTVAEMGLGNQTRRQALERARELIDEQLAELAAPAPEAKL